MVQLKSLVKACDPNLVKYTAQTGGSYIKHFGDKIVTFKYI